MRQERLSPNERIGLINLIDEGLRSGSPESPMMADLFNDLWELVNTTVSGSKIDRLKPKDSENGFQVFEINAETGETLGWLNMLYLKKPIPCYYLVYVEVAGPFRRKGLGNRILDYFRDFLIKKSAVGILDNIIPEEDPSYDIYFKHAWEPIDAVIGEGISDKSDNYMIYVPPKLQSKDLREPVMRLLYHLKRKRVAIDMRDNEVMVQRTIDEFKELYRALLTYFDEEIKQGKSNPLMRFMFTRFITKLIAFRRRIGTLVGYTGGESMEQIVLSPEIATLPIQSYVPLDTANTSTFLAGDRVLWIQLPDALKKNPARFIEALPNYRRPSLVEWLVEQGLDAESHLTLGDLMDLGFDPTRLKEISIGGEPFVFERVQARLLPDLENRKQLLERIASKISEQRVGNARLKANPPLLIIRGRGNVYVLRRKISGIHWEEAVEQLQSATTLKGMNKAMKLDRLIMDTARKAKETIADHMVSNEEGILEGLTCFVSWNLDTNQPRLVIDFTTASLESVWMA